MIASLVSSRDALLKPERLWTRSEVLERPIPVPRDPGVYAWYFDDVPPGVPVRGCHRIDAFWLLYIGISPSAPPANGKPPSRQRLRNRVRYHYRGNAEGSTLRLTLGCLLSSSLGIQLRRVGSGSRYTFADGEQKLTDWMSRHARVTWTVHPTPWALEEYCLQTLSLPLNLQSNVGHPFRSTLAAVRRSARAVAEELPVLTRVGSGK